jgi:CheY-like chemotaxis protein
MATILLVDNEPDNTSVLRMCLEDEVFEHEFERDLYQNNDNMAVESKEWTIQT